MPEPPHVEGLPLWAQLTISLIFGVAALMAAYSGYFKKNDKAAHAADPQSTAILAASISDGFAMRSLNESVVRLDQSVVNLCHTIDELTHYKRNRIDLDREISQQLRDLLERLDRHK